MRKNTGQIVRRYAAALFESAAEAKAVEPVAAQAEVLARAFTPDVLGFFVNPGVAETAKAETLASLIEGAKVNPILANFLKLLLANKRMPLVAEILREFLRKSDESLGIARVELVTAHTVGADEARQFEQALAQSLKKKIVLSQKVDESLKAGYLVRIGNTIVDASLKTRLQGLKDALTQGV